MGYCSVWLLEYWENRNCKTRFFNSYLETCQHSYTKIVLMIQIVMVPSSTSPFYTLYTDLRRGFSSNFNFLSQQIVWAFQRCRSKINYHFTLSSKSVLTISVFRQKITQFVNSKEFIHTKTNKNSRPLNHSPVILTKNAVPYFALDKKHYIVTIYVDIIHERI